MTTNLRRDARVDVSVPVALRRGSRTIELWTSDVSFRGLFLEMATDTPPLRSLVQLRVSLPNVNFDTHAMCVHTVDGVGVGLQFWGLSGADRAAWDDFVRREIERRAPRPRRATAAVENADAAGAEPHPSSLEQPTPSGIRVVAPIPTSKAPASK